ncbi:MAG: type VI secretion system contractile sheath small subunit [Gemmataceae bacterium]
MESLQNKLSRVRPPRVHITYKVETLGAAPEIELPFVVGILADLSGQSAKDLPQLKKREFVEIDRDNFNKVLAGAKPSLALRVKNRLTEEDGELSVKLQFESMKDFLPAQVAQQVPALAKLLETRENLKQLLSVIEGKEKVEELMKEIITNTEKAMELAKERGITLETTDGAGEGAASEEEPKADE